jgi:NAD(P)H-flavin reductase
MFTADTAHEDFVMKSKHSGAMIPAVHTVSRFKKETHDTFTVDLVPEKHADFFRFHPGQFNMLYLFGVGEVPISISGDPFHTGAITHTIRAYGSVTTRMMRLKRGDRIGVRGPFGNAWPIETCEGRDMLLVAGGIGVAPLRPVLYHVIANRERYGKVFFLYGERTPADLLYRNQIERWRGRFDLVVDVTVDSARQGWHGNVGVVTTLIPKIRISPENTIAMLCGPEIMMHYTIAEIEKKGIDASRIFISMERNMKCGVGFCGHCQLGPIFICKDGPVFQFSNVRHLFRKREL